MGNDNLYKYLLDSLSEGICVIDQDRMITYWNKGIENLTGYKNPEMVGKCCQGNALMYLFVNGRGVDVCENGCLAVKSIADGQTHSMEVYARHKDGYRVPVLVRTSPVKNSDGKIIGAVEEVYDNSSKLEFSHKVEELEKCALLDPLTGVMKRRGLEINLRSMFGVMHRYGWSYGVFFVSLDEFKKINDTYGNDIGNNVLKIVAKTLLNSVRATDVVGRWGGEEFIVIAMNISEDHLYSIANKIRILIEQSGFPVKNDTLHVTASVCATMVRQDDTVNTLLKRIDKLMDYSKISGKNCVSVKLDV